MPAADATFSSHGRGAAPRGAAPPDWQPLLEFAATSGPRIVRAYAVGQSRYRQDPVTDALQVNDTHGTCLLTLEMSDGSNGVASIGFGRLAAAPMVLANLINAELAPAIIGEDAGMIRAIRDKLWRLTDYHGTVGLAMFGIAAVDIALWDGLGKRLGQPVWRLLGAQRSLVPAYATVGWLNYDSEQLQSACSEAVRQGYKGVKVKVGSKDLAEDLRRLAAVRTAVGPRTLIMVDANQVLTRKEALRRGQAFEEAGCAWFEEPLVADDTEGLAELAKKLSIPIASGENNYGRRQFRRLFEQRAVDIVQPDIRRAGGFTECLEIGLMAAEHEVDYASHGADVHLHLLAVLPTATYAEAGLVQDVLSPIVDGCCSLPSQPGLSR